MRLHINIGTQLGRLTTIEEPKMVEKYGHRFSYTLCRCKCGTTKLLPTAALLKGRVKSCGCIKGRVGKQWSWWCKKCNLNLRTRKELFEHNRKYHPHTKGEAWNKGLTKETDIRIMIGRDKLINRIAKGEVVNYFKGKHLSKEHRQKVSEGMKKAHAEGRAHNIGTCRWNNEPSYPESFFMKVIDNHFEDKDYKREFPFIRFSLDFAWVHKKKVIEIDGDQHWRFQEVINRDKKKDALLQDKGWQVLRIRWIDMYKEPQTWIAKAKDFIDSQWPIRLEVRSLPFQGGEHGALP